MRTRTVRWLVITFALAIPVTTALVIRHQAKVVRLSAGSIAETTRCADAARLVPVDRTVAIARFRTILDAASSSGTDRVCAAAALADLQAPTVADRAFRAAQSTINWISNRLSGSDAQLSTSASGPLLVVLFAIEVLALILAIGQFVLWRSERWPGPVAVGDIAAPPDDAHSDGLAEIIKDRLASAGVPPGTAAPGKLAAVVVDAVDAGVGASTGWPAQLMQSLVGALRPKAGFTVTGRAFASDGSDLRCVTLEAAVTRNGTDFTVVTGRAASYEEAAIDAAYQLYLALADRDEVRRRTPEWLAWTSTGGLESYNDGLRDLDDNDDAGGIAALRKAAAEEPANALVLIRLAQSLWALADGTPDSDVLRALDHRSDREMTGQAVSAVEWILRLVYRSPQSDDALFIASIYLGYVEGWINAWRTTSPARRDRTVQLVEDAIRRVSFTKREWQFGDVDPNSDAAVERFRHASEILTRRALANQHYWNVCWRARQLAQRRETAGRILPWSRIRFNRRHAALALLDGLRWDELRWKCRTDPYVAAEETAQQTIGSGLRRLRVRVGKTVWRDPDHVVEWNLAVAYACEARMRGLTSSTPAGILPSDARRGATRQLRLALLSVTGRVSGSDVDSIASAPDLSIGVSGVREPLPFIKRWSVPLTGEQDDERVEMVWSEALSNVSKVVATAVSAWEARLITTAAMSSATHVGTQAQEEKRRNDLVSWFGSDRTTWDALATWMNDPSDGAKRATLAKALEVYAESAGKEPDDLQPSSRFPRAAVFRALRRFVNIRAHSSSQANEQAVDLAIRQVQRLPQADVQVLARAAWLRWTTLRDALVKG